MNTQGLDYLFDTDFQDANANWKACCPFHGESSPSFMINKDTGQAYCWGCGWSGSVISAIQEYLGVSRERANRLASDKLQFRLVEGILNRRKAQSNDVEVSEAWLEAWPQKIHKSILERGLSVDVLRAARTRYDAKGGGRQVFPHRDKRGTLVGAAGRALGGQDPKWYFYWGYSKGRSLYYGTLEPKHEARKVYVVEGVFDVLWLQQHGITNAVGILGSKPSKYQLAALSEYDEVILALDRDLAGYAGTLRLYNGLRRNVKTKFIEWPGNDPMDTKGEDLWQVTPKNYFEWRKSSHAKSMSLQLESLTKRSSSQTSSKKRTSPTVMQP